MSDPLLALLLVFGYLFAIIAVLIVIAIGSRSQPSREDARKLREARDTNVRRQL